MLHEYLEHERTPFPSTMFVSALCQLWIFGLYELLRTWCQRGKDVLRWSKEFHALPVGDRPARLVAKRKEIEVDLVSRRTLSDECKRLALDRSPAIIPEHLQDHMKRYPVKRYPDDSYGIKRIAVTLDDGTEHQGVYVAWRKEIVGIDGMEELPFDPDRNRDSA